MTKKAVIYILTNPSFPGYVKIGYADDIDKMIKAIESQRMYSVRIPSICDIGSEFKIARRI